MSSSQKTKVKIGELTEKIENSKFLSEAGIDDDDVWCAVKSFVRENGMMSGQIRSFNDFIYNKSHQIVELFKQVIIEEKTKDEPKRYVLELSDLVFKEPSFTEKDDSTHDLYPVEALQRNITYCSAMYIDVTVITPSGESTFYEKIFLGNMPVMTRSDLCHVTTIVEDPEAIAKNNEDFYDGGGYFVVSPKGEGTVAQRRILVPQERSAPNKVYIFSNRKMHPKYKKYAEIRSSGDNVHMTTTTVGFMPSGYNGRISAVLPWIDATEIPLGVLFFALGATSYQEICMYVVGPPDDNTWKDEGKKEILNILLKTLEYSYEIQDQESALYFIGKKGRKFVKEEKSEDEFNQDFSDDEENEIDMASILKEKSSAISYANHLLTSEFLSHVGNHLPNKDKSIEKAKYLGYIVHKLILVLLGRKNPESRDHYMNKRVLSSGTLLAQQFYGGLRRLIMEITKNTRKALRNGNTVNISSWIKPSIITNAMQGAISGNNWTTGGPAAKGISQVYEQFNYASSIANARKDTVPIAAEGGKVIEPRDLHGSHFGLICVTGDTLVLLADGKTLCRIDELEGKSVMTVNTVSLKSEPSGIYNFFKMMPKRLLEIKDDCGRSIRCTPDHPFLVHLSSGENIWVSAGNLKLGDSVIISSLSNHSIELFQQRSLPEGKCISYISEISDVDPEYVYDFTTISENHSFISNEFVTHQCPAETPEGKKAGLVKNMAFMSLITTGTNFEPVRLLLNEIIGKSAEKNYPLSLTWARVFLNGVPIGHTKTPKKIVSTVRSYRRTGKITSEISVAFSKSSNEIHMCIDHGRLCRPLFIVENGKLLFDLEKVKQIEAGEISWSELLVSGTVELLDKMEEEECYVVGFPSDIENILTSKHKNDITHCEIHPALMYGIGGSIIPFSNHNQSPRNCYQASMGKQAVGVPFSNYRTLMCGSFHTLMYLHQPLALTRSASILRFDEMPAGQNAIVAIMPRPFNEEDSIEMNQDSIDRGFMVSFKWTCFYAEIREENSENFGIPTEDMKRFKGDPKNLTKHGYPKPGKKIKKGDIVIGKIIEHSIAGKREYVNSSQIYDHEWPSTVDKIMVGTTGEGYKFIRVMLCQRREPIVGDKFSFMHGQKGTIGMKPRSIDLPFNNQGITPDIVMNSLALPSRMTIGMLIEAWTGKVVISSSRLHNIKVSEIVECKNEHEGDTPERVSKSLKVSKSKLGPSDEFRKMFCHKDNPASIDATPFRKFDINVIKKEMSKYGLKYGDECLTDGVTGKKLRALIFFVPAHSQRLKHMVIDKIHARARGGKTTLMRQPHEGRAAGGGLRFGVMERDCILGQGAGKFARDRLIICSDDFRQWVCDVCGLAVGNKDDGCKICGLDKVSLVRIPYGTKIVNQELMALNIVPRTLTTSHSTSK
jgi:DNA-directed RNA polymerase beta subunit